MTAENNRNEIILNSKKNKDSIPYFLLYQFFLAFFFPKLTIIKFFYNYLCFKLYIKNKLNFCSNILIT